MYILFLDPAWFQGVHTFIYARFLCIENLFHALTICGSFIEVGKTDKNNIQPHLYLFSRDIVASFQFYPLNKNAVMLHLQ